MDSFRNMFSGSFRSRDEHGVGELLDAVSRRSSVNQNDRQALSDMARRVRTTKPQSPVKRAQESPSSSSHGSSHGNGSTHSGTNPAFEVDLLRGFGPSKPVANPAGSKKNSSSAGLLRDFGPPRTNNDDSISDDAGADSGL